MTDQRNTGGQAFPMAGSEHGYPNDGMTLRDYFAAKAMQGLLAGSSFSDHILYNLKELPEEAYQIADAMLEIRYE